MRKTDQRGLKVKKLVLSKETLRLLNSDELRDAKGGLINSFFWCTKIGTDCGGSGGGCTGTDATCSCDYVCH